MLLTDGPILGAAAWGESGSRDVRFSSWRAAQIFVTNCQGLRTMYGSASMLLFPGFSVGPGFILMNLSNLVATGSVEIEGNPVAYLHI